MKVDLTLAVGRYAITEALVDGSVDAQGVDLRTLSMPSPERHSRMLRHREFDVCELSLAGYVQALSREPEEWTAIPVFPHRRYRHGYIFLPIDSPIETPEQLAGAAIGLRIWATTAGVWTRGILQDEYGVDLRGVTWKTEHSEHVGSPNGHGFQVGLVPEGGELRAMLSDGSLQAVIYPERLRGRDVRPLFRDAWADERSYAERTGLFPIMHLVAVRRQLLEKHAWLAAELLKAFEEAKRQAYRRVSDPRWLPLAWGEHLLAEQGELLGSDPWRYRFEANVRELETALRYCHEQELTSRRLRPAELFWPSTVEASPVYAAAH